MNINNLSKADLGRILKALRKQAGLSQKALGHKVGLSSSSISRIERGKKDLGSGELDQYIQRGDLNQKKFNSLADSALEIRKHELKVKKEKREEPGGKKISKINMLKILRDYFHDKPVKKVYLFGSIARDEHIAGSDIDLYLSFAENYRVTIFDLGKMQFEINRLTGKEVDLVLEGSEYDFIKENLNREKILVYG